MTVRKGRLDAEYLSQRFGSALPRNKAGQDAGAARVFRPLRGHATLRASTTIFHVRSEYFQKAEVRRRFRHAFDLERYVCIGLARSREDPAAGCGVCIPGRQLAAFRQTRAGTTESLRSGGLVDAVEYRAERDHRRRQQCEW